MGARLLYTLALMLAVTMCAGLRAADGEKPKGGGAPGRQIQALLDHADDLGLTAEQKSKLQEMAKGPMSVLTDEQKTKAKDILHKATEGGEKKMKKEKGDGADAKKPEDKKPDETKPGEKKADDAK